MYKKSNRPFFIAAVLAIAVSILLSLNRDWNEKESVNESVLEAWGTIMAAIFTAVTVYLLFKQNQQQLDDRKAASKPDIYPAEANVITTDENENEEYEYGKEQLLINKVLFSQYRDNTEKKYQLYFPILLHNIGLGAAKRIKYKWKFNKEDVFNFVNGAYHLPKPSANENEFHLEAIIDFIPTNNSVKIHLPYYFTTSFGKSINVNNDEGFHKEQPKLQLHVEYLDIHNNLYVKIFMVSFSRMFEFVDIKFNES